MFSAGATTEDHTQRVLVAAKKAKYERFQHAAASISKTMKASIVKGSSPAGRDKKTGRFRKSSSNAASAPGEPPHTRGRAGHNLKGAIRYDANNIDAVVGPIASFIGQAGHAHEFGGEYRGEQFPKRPFARPALEANVDRFAAGWVGSIGE